MRLTLRTLLAYLDDMLPPAETKEIGQKVQESESVQELVERIRKVTRRRRLTAPNMSPTSDEAVNPNTVAEYLDNVLPPEELADLERLCLESDVNLAEVAACHQILTVILGEPANVPPTAYQKMYQLVSGREVDPARKPRKSSLRARTTPVVRTPEEDEALLLGMPPMQREAPWYVRLIPVAVAVMLVGLLAGVVYLATSGEKEPTPVASNPTPAPLPPVRPTQPSEELVVRMPPPEDPEPVVALPEDVRRLAWLANLGQSPDHPGSTLGSVPLCTTWVASLPSTPANLFLLFRRVEPPPARQPEPEPPPPPARPAIPPPVVDQVALGRYEASIQKDHIPSLLVRRVADNDWRLSRNEAAVRSGELLVSLAGYRSDLALNNGMKVSLIGSLPVAPMNYVLETAAMLHANPDVDADVTLERGRLHILNKPMGPGRVRLRFADQVWHLTLPDAKTEVGIEVTGRVPRGVGPWVPHTKISLIALSGDVLLVRGEKEETLQAGKVLLWDTQTPPKSPPVLAPMPEAPSWMKRKNSYPEEVRTAMAQFSDRLARKPGIADQKTTWMSTAFLESLEENNRWQRWLGLFGLGAIDQLSFVVKALENEDRPDMRFAAVDTLLHWLGRRPNQDAELRPVLRQRDYSADDTEYILQLLRGYEQVNATTVEILLNNLNHPRLSVRELSFINLNLILPQDKLTGYNPLAPEDIRARAIDTLRARILPK